MTGRQPALGKSPAPRKAAETAAGTAGEIAALRAELADSLRQQAATADVLKVISGAALDLQQVFETVAEHAVRLCEADKAFIFRFDGALLRVAVAHNASPELRNFIESNPIRPGRHSGAARAALEHRTVHIADVRADPEYTYGAREADEIRTVLGVPMLKGDTLLGVMMIYRLEVRPFTDRHIALVETFADQAAIAIENARLFSELRESLEQQTATGEVLHAIASSPGEVERVLDTIARTAHGLFGAWATSITRIEGGVFRQAAAAGEHRQSLAAHLSRQAVNRNIAAGLAAVEKRVVHIENLKAEMARFPESPPPARLAGSSLTAPLLQAGAAIGTITVTRLEVRPFTDKEIALLQSLAAQAVIAIENARLLTELRESLDFQIATGDVLKAISRTTFDLDPVLTTMAETAARLCQADKVVVFRAGDDGMFRFAAGCSLDPDYIAHERRSVIAPGRGSIVGRAALEGRTVQIHDAWNDPEYDDREAARIGNVRAMLGVPLIRAGEIIGAFGLGRAEPNPYTQKQVELVTTFADQAVIAIENARLLAELRDTLETQTASADILRTIAASPADAAHALDAIAQTTARLFGASGAAIRTVHGDRLRAVGSSGAAGKRLRVALGEEFPLTPDTLPGAVVLEKRTIHIPDNDHRDPTIAHWPGLAPQRAAGIRTIVGTPLMREGQAIGALMVQRNELKPFTDTELAQLANFADQAVIAIENARLLGELRSRTDELAQRQAELRVTFDNMGDGVVMFDGQLRLAAWNRNLQELLDLPESFFAAPRTFRDYLSFLSARGEFATDGGSVDRSRYDEDTTRRERFERTRPDGRILEVRRNPVPGGGFVLIYSDVTERKQAEGQIRAARDAAERALGDLRAAQANLIQAEKMASLGQLTAGIAHEIKNPLNFVNNFAGLSVELLDEFKESAEPAIAGLDPDKRSDVEEVIEMLTGNLQKIAEHGRRADGIVKSMLAHSRGGSGDRQAVNVNALLEESLNLAYHGARAQDQNFNVTLERDLDPAIAPIEVVPQDLTRVFLNLFGNGFYAVNKRRREAGEPAYGPALKVTTRDGGGEVLIRIRDNGTGIPPDVRARLFEPFFTTKPTGEGTGLGLSISYEIVTQQHGGSIAVESEVGAFTEFTIVLPRRAAATGRPSEE